MKTRLLIIIGIISIILLVPSLSYGMWSPQTHETLMEQSETVFVGIIKSVNVLEFEKSNSHQRVENGVSKIIIKNYTQSLDEYTVNIEEFLKNPQESNTITMLQATVGGVPGYGDVAIGGFELNERVLFFVPKLDGTNQYSPESFKIPKDCDAKSVLKQSKNSFSSNFRKTQDGILITDNFTANKPIQVVYDKYMRTLEGTSFDVYIDISKILENKTKQIVIQEHIHTESQPCEWMATASWEILLPAGRYYSVMQVSSGNNSGDESVWGGFNVIESISEPKRVRIPGSDPQNIDAIQLERSAFDHSIPPPLKQMKLGIKLGHIICDKDKFPVWNIHNKPACVYSDSESELLKRGWAKLRLLLPASADPIKELDWTGKNVMSMMLEGTFSYTGTPLETLDEKRAAIGEYSKQYHLGEQYLEYAIIPHQNHYNVGDKVKFDLLEWGNYQDCWDLKLRIIDRHDESVYEDNSVRYCLEPIETPGVFHSYSMGKQFDEFICEKPEYYRIEVSNGDIFPPTLLQNFACLESETDSLRPDDRLQIRHAAGYTTVNITLSSWDEYYQWENDRGTEHDAMPPILFNDTNINPIVLDLLNEMWKFENYEVSEYDDNLFIKNIEKDYSVPNHHGINDWLELESEKQFGKSKDGVSYHFEYRDNVYTVIMLAVD